MRREGLDLAEQVVTLFHVCILCGVPQRRNGWQETLWRNPSTDSAAVSALAPWRYPNFAHLPSPISRCRWSRLAARA